MTYSELMQYKDVKKEIIRLEEQLATLENRLTSPRVPILSDMPSSPTHNHAALEEGVVKLIMLKKKYEDLLKESYARQLAIEESIEALDPIERDLIRCRYFKGLKWEDVQKEIGYAQKQTYRIHNRAIEKIIKKSFENEQNGSQWHSET